MWQTLSDRNLLTGMEAAKIYPTFYERVLYQLQVTFSPSLLFPPPPPFSFPLPFLLPSLPPSFLPPSFPLPLPPPPPLPPPLQTCGNRGREQATKDRDERTSCETQNRTGACQSDQGAGDGRGAREGEASPREEGGEPTDSEGAA